MTKKAFKQVLEAARQAGVTVDSVKSGTQRVTAVIAGRTYGGVNAAKDAITNEYLRQKTKRR